MVERGDFVRAPPTVWVLLGDLSRTGVPITLLRTLRADPRARSSVHVIARRGGPLEADMRRVSSSLTVVEPSGRRSLANGLAVGLDSVGAPVGARVDSFHARYRTAGLANPDVVVIHGAGGSSLLGAVRGKPPVVLHLHELATGLDRSVPIARQQRFLRRAAAVLAVSRPVADLAVARGARLPKVELLGGAVDTAEQPSVTTSLSAAPVMGAGTPGWRKGTDRLAAIAYAVGEHLSPACGPKAHTGEEVRGTVGWVGGPPSGPDAPWVDSPDPVRWLAERAEPWSVMSGAQVVIIPSREDPLPLVALEAGLYSRPVVAMPTGGLVSLLGEGRGLMPERHDVGEFVDCVIHLLANPAEARQVGDGLRAHVLRHHESSTIAAAWWEVLERVAGSSRGIAV